MSFTLHILNDDRVRYTATEVYRPKAEALYYLVHGSNASAPYADAPGYRIVDNNRDKRLALKPKFRKSRRQANNGDRIAIQEQARRAAALFKERGPGPVLVFPCGGVGHSNDFRYFLALHLLEVPRKEWGDNWNTRRRKNEELCAEAGYPFEEVDPEDFK